ncbi:branched-chain amino acid ABC transporter permease [Arthrobacter sp. AZCC_0090]|uniref:branched-chain amino acid ABC transporter permease n=1 Tax=Arthrobacter sp. AZCC_0090 TaxID=2735881 RepID=UPI001614F076|nr:branched-chain amino acid ABC transporter permease [Arthrobacter sp. AZCC_0090]MBB6405252.1 branched-chain amino acid transport system permease protein [Arthrobacter sp. AZCC_0090]
MTLVWAALALGSVYIIVALGFNIVMASNGLFNFAAPQFIMIGAFLGYAVFTADSSALTLTLVIVGAGTGGAVLGYLEERFAVRPLLKRGHRHGVLVTTIGVAVVIEGVAFALFGSDALPVPFEGASTTLSWLGGGIQIVDVTLISLAIVLALGFHFASKYTRWGLSGRAVTADKEAALLRGVNSGRVSVTAFALSGGLLTVCGIFIGVKLQASYHLGTELVLIGFVAFALGGFGSYLGAILGGLFLGALQMGTAFFLGGEYQLLVVYGVLLAVLLIKPTGILGDRRIRSV